MFQEMDCLGMVNGSVARNITRMHGLEAINMSDVYGLSGEEFLAGCRNGTQTDEEVSSPDIQVVRVLRILQPIVSFCGIIGNLLTLAVLARKRLKESSEGIERTVNMGLTALAVSELCFCVSLFPYGIVVSKDSGLFESKTFELYYRTYGTAVINTFILTSTWLTIAMAFSRYLGICHPFKARSLIGMTGTRVTIVLIYLVCLGFNVPRYFLYSIFAFPDPNGKTIYVRVDGYMASDTKECTIYIWVYFFLGILIPLTLLAFCNINLIKALRASLRFRQKSRVPVSGHQDSNHRITSILVTIVVMYIVLVSPAEVLLFVQDRMPHLALLLPVQLTNLLQCVNFSCNFILYFALNVNFRRELQEMFPCCSFACGKAHPIQRQASYRTMETPLSKI